MMNMLYDVIILNSSMLFHILHDYVTFICDIMLNPNSKSKINKNKNKNKEKK